MHHLLIRSWVEAALGPHASKLLLWIKHHLLLIWLATLLLGSTLVVKLWLPGIIEAISTLEHCGVRRRARNAVIACGLSRRKYKFGLAAATDRV
jgi:hypothetical protein